MLSLFGRGWGGLYDALGRGVGDRVDSVANCQKSGKKLWTEATIDLQLILPKIGFPIVLIGGRLFAFKNRVFVVVRRGGVAKLLMLILTLIEVRLHPGRQ